MEACKSGVLIFFECFVKIVNFESHLMRCIVTLDLTCFLLIVDNDAENAQIIDTRVNLYD